MVAGPDADDPGMDLPPPLPGPRSWVVVATAAASVGIGSVLQAQQSRSLGDEPVPMLILGALLAFAAGALDRRRPVRLGIAAMGAFPVVAIVDLMRHGGHSLLPFEFGIYGLYAAVGAGCALCGRGLGRP